RRRVGPLRAAGLAGSRQGSPGWYHSSRGSRSGWAEAGCGSVAIAFEQVVIGIDPAVAQERPYPSHVLAALQVDLGHQGAFGVPGFGEELALRPEHVAVTPEVDTRRPQ